MTVGGTKQEARQHRQLGLLPHFTFPVSSFRVLPLLLLLLLASGCFQIETRVKVAEDGSAVITERFYLSRRLLEFEKAGGSGPALSTELSREAVQERMKLMGKGITLVSHAIREGEAGGRESVTVFSIPDVTELQYASPYFSMPGYQGRFLMKGRAVPRLYTDNYNPPGYTYLSFEPVVTDAEKAKPPPPRRKEDPEPRPPSPVELQALRHLQPVIRDMLDGLRLRFTIESYATMYAGWGAPGVRNGSTNTKEIDLIDVSDNNLDAFGANVLENEEIMLELEQIRFNGPNLMKHTEGWVGNLTLPLLMGRPQPAIFRPSKHFFERLYAGKEIDFGPRGGGKRPADFKEIGWHPTPSAPAK